MARQILAGHFWFMWFQLVRTEKYRFDQSENWVFWCELKGKDLCLKGWWRDENSPSQRRLGLKGFNRLYHTVGETKEHPKKPFSFQTILMKSFVGWIGLSFIVCATILKTCLDWEFTKVQVSELVLSFRPPALISKTSALNVFLLERSWIKHDPFLIL